MMINRQLAYKDDTGELFVVVADGQVFIDAELIEPSKVSHIKRYLAVLAELEHNLRNKGVTEIFAVVSSKERYRFAQYLGFTTTNQVINDKYEVVRKVLF
jgi:hypothetical protein